MKRRLSQKEKEAVIKRDGLQCRYCGSRLNIKDVQFDHVYPFSLGGVTSIENSVIACRTCNARKSDKVGVWPRPLNYQYKFVNRVFWIVDLFLIIASFANGIMFLAFWQGFWYWLILAAIVLTLDVVGLIMIKRILNYG